MSTIVMIAVDLVAISILAFGLYFPRHHRSDLVAAFLGVNVGVLAVSIVLVDSSVGMGLGLGLFGVLSIIRLRSSEISQHEVAYYFASLAIGLISGMATVLTPLTVGLVVLVLAALAVGDSPRLLGAHRSQLVQLDRAIADEGELRSALAQLLGGEVTDMQVVKLDLVNDLTLVEARYRVLRPGRGGDTTRDRRGPGARQTDDVPAVRTPSAASAAARVAPGRTGTAPTAGGITALPVREGAR
ncbi:DUF4956 domain-containing protein [Actinomyces provencensis]|uniref:DUF4956 domain-containing protein n=1 Tax=Actinomyces provencensis TaxID=1720198 RepID=UPI00096AC59B|nr:DUF4956 domain-containing protein [Actinomyces provencensis]